MTDYKRLTTKRVMGVFSSFNGAYKMLCKDCRLGNKLLPCPPGTCEEILAERLGELEDKIESGELREVPRGAVILTPEELEKEVGAVREERVEFERRIELLNNELNRELFEHKAFVEKTAIEVGRLKAEKERAVKEFAEKLKERVLKFVWKCNIPECIFKDIITDLLKEYEEQLDEFADCKTCPAWSGSDCTRNPYTEGCLKEEAK